MLKIMIVGNVSCGKTTLCQILNGQDRVFKKTQTIEVVGHILDTPGEYIENRALNKALVVSSVDVDIVFLLQDCTDMSYNFSPGQASMFSVPTVGIVTKIDEAPHKEAISDTKELLKLAGVKRIFCVSAHTGEGIAELLEFLDRVTFTKGDGR